MKKNVAFTQLGKKIAPFDRKEYKRKSILSILIINQDKRHFSKETVKSAWQIIKALDGLGEITIIDNDFSRTQTEALLKEFPEIRILVPTRPVSFHTAFFLGLKEAMSPHVLVIDSSCKIDSLELDCIFRTFQDKRTFAMGFRLLDSESNPVPSVVKAFLDRGRMTMIEGNRDFAASSLFLKNFYGIYDRKKAIFLEEPDMRMKGIWSSVDYFFRGWSRGWITTIDPVNRLQADIPVPPAAEESGFFRKFRYHRQELRFLKKHFLDPESRRYRKRHFLIQGWKKLIRLDPAMFISFFIENLSSAFSWTTNRKRAESFLTPMDVFHILMETGKHESTGNSTGKNRVKKASG